MCQCVDLANLEREGKAPSPPPALKEGEEDKRTEEQKKNDDKIAKLRKAKEELPESQKKIEQLYWEIEDLMLKMH